MFYVMSDIHGCIEQFEIALEKWDPKIETLVIMGDLIDRGPNSLEVVRKAMELKEKYGEKVVVLKGNHEDMLLQWLFKTPLEYLGLYYTDTHEETLKSFLGKERFKKESRRQRALSMIKMFKAELQFLNNLPLYKETDKIIFVHAGIPLTSDNWREQSDDLLWIRNDFIYSEIRPEKRVFFGHTQTQSIYNSEPPVHNIWISPDSMKVGIDGGVSMGGQLNCLKVYEDGEIFDIIKVK